MDHTHNHLTREVNPATAATTAYDVVIVGAGIAGSVMANELAKQCLRILLLEAGPGKDLTLAGYQNYLKRFYTSVDKFPNSPYPKNQNAPMPRAGDIRRLDYGEPDTGSYIVQNGPAVLDGNYARVVGGTTMHWQGNTPRMLPEDFVMEDQFGQGGNWPLAYEDLMPYYRKAEAEIGVAANVEEQAYFGMTFEPEYVFPMLGMPPTYLDKVVAENLTGITVELAGETKAFHVRGIPQGRNGIPNPKYKATNGGKDFVPVGAVSEHQAEEGERCQGNTNCTPICPVQAKYDARKSLAAALRTGNVDLLTQTVASKVLIDATSGEVNAIEYKHYYDFTSGRHETGTVKGRTFVLAANAIENARLMLASDLPSSSNLMGRNLMNHQYLFSWGLMPELVGAMRGTQGTSGIEDFRGGAFRSGQAAFHIDIINNGWTYATGAPFTDLVQLVEQGNKFGTDLRQAIVNQVSRQIMFTAVVEQLPDPNNRVTVNPAYADQLGNLRPVIDYNIADYSLNGLVYARRLFKRLFRQMGAEDHTQYSPLAFGYAMHDGEHIEIHGGNHFSGTHIMGDNPATSVVTPNQRSWDHDNLFLVGSGSMPTIGTSNTTLTLVALCYKTVEAIVTDLSN